MGRITGLIFMVLLLASLSHVAEAKTIICDEWQTYIPSKNLVENHRSEPGYTPTLEFDDETGEIFFLGLDSEGDADAPNFRGKLVDYGNLVSIYSISTMDGDYMGWFTRIDYHRSTRIYILTYHSLKKDEIPGMEDKIPGEPLSANPAEEFEIHWGVCRPDMS